MDLVSIILVFRVMLPVSIILSIPSIILINKGQWKLAAVCAIIVAPFMWPSIIITGIYGLYKWNKNKKSTTSPTPYSDTDGENRN